MIPMRRIYVWAAFFTVLLNANWALGISISDLRQTGTGGAVVSDVTGVVVMDLEHMDYHMGRVHIQDTSGQLWGGIVLIDETDGAGGYGELVQQLEVGDLVTLHNVVYGPDSWTGNDVIYFQDASSYSITFDVGVPDAVEVTPNQIFGATGDVGEEYQSMRVTVKDVSISQMSIGNKGDVYEIVNQDGDVALAGDYANSEKLYSLIWWDTDCHHYTCPDTPTASPGKPFYNPISDDGYGGVGQHFASISGIIEKSVLTDSYHQLLTVDSNDFEFAIPGDANGDRKVDSSDATILAGNWQSTNATWWDGDFNNDKMVDASDATILAGHWQEGVDGSLTTAVPEPQAWTLMATLLLLSTGVWFKTRR